MLTLAAAALLCGMAGAGAARPAPVYERDVLPLFRARCFGCHGAALPEAGLDVRRADDLIEGGHSGPAVRPGKPEESLLYRMLADGRMPKGGARFSPAELRQVGDWIRSGARGEDSGGHWAFRPPRPSPVPRVAAADRVRNPIDAFVLAKLEAKGLTLSPEADPRTLIRRVTFDLTGLPPTPEEIDAFLRDCGPGIQVFRYSGIQGRTPTHPHTPTPPPPTTAYERLVDRLLASPAYGERWARHWLDTAGYADSEGVLQEDRVRPNAWRYRDYVIRSFNQDKPYDRFLREQLAGDELSGYRTAPQITPEIVEQLEATGFLRTAVDATRDDFNTHQFTEYQYRMLHDTQTIVVSSALGLTLQCARCHDHKYEPFSQKDYYRVQALFTGAIRPTGKLLPTNRRQVVAATETEQKHAAEVNAAVDKAVAENDRQQAALLRRYRERYLQERLSGVPEADRERLVQAAGTEDAKRTAEQKALVQKHAALVNPSPAQVSAAYPEYERERHPLAAARAAEEKKRIVYPSIRALYDQDAAPPPTRLLVRGDWTRPGDAVEPGVPAVLESAGFRFELPAAPAGANTTGRRRAFAEWLTRPENPLTARVIVNRVWAHHFGVGIVPSVDNFGRSGVSPTHRELLDWLAFWFAQPAASAGGEWENGRMGEWGGRTPSSGGLGWSLKKLHRLIVLSSTYRQSGNPSPPPAPRVPGSPSRRGESPSLAARALNPQSAIRNPQSSNPQSVDPENRLLWRQRVRRLEAEAVRDAVLAAAGTLDRKLYGEPVPLETRPTGENAPAGEAVDGRRSLYLMVRRSQPVDQLNVFDAPVMEVNCTRRVTSTTASQALALMNSGFVAAQSGHFARRVLKECPAGDGAGRTLDRAYLLALGRPPSPSERAAALDFLADQQDRYSRLKAEDPALKAWTDLCQALLGTNEFVYVD